VGAGDLTAPISVRARFERFPATVKGAFIFRGEDRDPHLVVIEGARVSAIGGGSSPMPMAPATLNVIPHRDVFVPFELPVTELDSGWYTLVCDLVVDGIPGAFDGGRRFSVPWPRATVRRGQVKVERGARVGEAEVIVEHLDCSGDSIKLHLRMTPPGPLTVKLTADGRRLTVLELELDEASGRGRVTAYPLMRTDRALGLELRGRVRGAQASFEVPLD
jgi:hypothetical protein